MASTTRQIANTLLRQQQKSIVLKVCQRSLHSSAVRLQTVTTHNEPTKKNFAESLTDKFIGQVWKQRQQYKDHREPTRFVQIDALPHTATTEDVYKLAREAFPKGDKNIVEMTFCRNNEFHFFGRCVVVMSNAEDARRLLEYAHRRTLGGNILKANYIGSNNSNVNDIMSAFRRPELTSMTDATNASGRSVIITGLPTRTRPEHLLGYLRSRNFFPVEGAPDNVLQLKTKEQSTVSKFLVKFDSESEAWRCVRSFHNTDFILNNRPETYKLQLNVAY